MPSQALSEMTNAELTDLLGQLRSNLQQVEALLLSRSSASCPPPLTPPQPQPGPSCPPAADPMEAEEAVPFVKVARKRKTRSPTLPKSPPSKNRFIRDSATSGTSDDSTSAASSDEEDSAPVRKPPPIIIRNREKWNNIHTYMLDKSITYRRAINTTEGITLYLNNIDHFRQITRKMDSDGIHFSTFQPLEDRELVVVIRGVNQAFSEDEVLRELKMKVPATLRVHRMRSKEKIFPLVAVHLDSSASSVKSIFDIRAIGGLAVKVEAKRKSSKTPQCNRCQKFFHTGNYCRSPFVCAFCGRNHITAECRQRENTKNTPTCANCKGAHWATFRGCPKVPSKSSKSAKAPSKAPPVAPRTVHATLTAGQSYAKAAAPKPAQAPKSAQAPKRAPAPKPAPAPKQTPPLLPSLPSIPSDQLQATITMIVTQVVSALFTNNYALPAQ